MIPKMQQQQLGAGADVCEPAKDGNGTCAHCGKALEGTVRRRFCDNNDRCRIAAYRTKQKAARKARKIYHYQQRNRARALGTFRGYGGPIYDGIPKRFGSMELRNFMNSENEN